MRIYIGYDSREVDAYAVCEHTLRKYSSTELDIIPLKQKELRTKGYYRRPQNEKVSTEFTFTRFLVPFLNGFSGYCLFCDCDFMFTQDVNQLLKYANDEHAVSVCKHDYIPKSSIKMDGQANPFYPRKNWSSLILYNCAHSANTVLGPQTIATATPSWLHRFSWLEDNQIGDIPLTWNHLVGQYDKPLPAAIHFTEGGPWFENYRDVDYSKEWEEALNECKHNKQR